MGKRMGATSKLKLGVIAPALEEGQEVTFSDELLMVLWGADCVKTVRRTVEELTSFCAVDSERVKKGWRLRLTPRALKGIDRLFARKVVAEDPPQQAEEEKGCGDEVEWHRFHNVLLWRAHRPGRFLKESNPFLDAVRRMVVDGKVVMTEKQKQWLAGIYASFPPKAPWETSRFTLTNDHPVEATQAWSEVAMLDCDEIEELHQTAAPQASLQEPKWLALALKRKGLPANVWSKAQRYPIPKGAGGEEPVPEDLANNRFWRMLNPDHGVDRTPDTE